MSTSPSPVMFQPPPPTQPGGFVRTPPPSSWPLALGIVAIIFGGGGLLVGCFGAAGLLFMDKVVELVEDSPGMTELTTASLQAATQHKGLQLGLTGLGLILSLMLLLAGIGMLSRKRSSRTLSLAWSAMKMLFVPVHAGVAYYVGAPQLEAMQQDPNMAQLPQGFIQGALIGQTVFMVAWGWALPVFLLIWLNRAKIRAEVAAWTA